MENKMIKYLIKQSLSYLKYKSLDELKILIMYDKKDIFSNILKDFEIPSDNITLLDISNFDFLFEENIGNDFDLILANPPYKRHEKIKELKEKLKSFKSFNNTANIDGYIFEKAYQMLGADGIFGFISLDNYEQTKYAKEFRRFILDSGTILDYIKIENENIMIYQNAYAKENSVFNYAKIDKIIKDWNDFNTKYTYSYLQDDLDEKGFLFLPQKVLKVKKIIEKTQSDNSLYSDKLLLAMRKSKVLKFYKESMIYKDIKQLPIPKISKEAQKPFEILVDYVSFAKENDLSLEASLFESVINGLVYDLYFADEMKKGDCFISDEVREIVKPWGKSSSEKIKMQFVDLTYKAFKESRTVERGLIYSRVISVVEVINGVNK